MAAPGGTIPKYTLNFLKALLGGCTVVAMEWLDACMAAGAWLDVGPYLVRGHVEFLGGPERARRAKLAGALG